SVVRSLTKAATASPKPRILDGAPCDKGRPHRRIQKSWTYPRPSEEHRPPLHQQLGPSCLLPSHCFAGFGQLRRTPSGDTRRPE
ncbi:hypothetical protein, partial [Streptomyces umbrinus]|uniref:hypothetical protein n=1 Tax=Streptomyces umbrinus TaxID=67370 RepID=UPI0034475933